MKSIYIISLFLTLLITHFSVVVIGQNNFIKSYLVFSSGNIYQLPSNNYLVNRINGVTILDYSGNTIFQKYFARSSQFTTLKVLKIDTNIYSFNGLHTTPCASVAGLFPMVNQVDTNGSFLNHAFYYNFNSICGYWSEGFYLQRDSSMLISGYGWPCGNCIDYPFVISTEKNGSVRWSHYFQLYKGGARFAIDLGDSSVIAGLNIDAMGPTLVKFNSSGAILWQKSLWRPRGVMSDAVKTPDGGALIVGYTDSVSYFDGSGTIPASFNAKLVIMKLDNTGNVAWSKQYSCPTSLGIFPASITSMSDSTFAIATNTIDLVSYIHSADILILKIDEQGNILFSSQFGNPFLSERPWSINMDNYGNLLMISESFGILPGGVDHSMTVRLDSSGVANCHYNNAQFSVSNFQLNDSIVVIPTSGDTAIAYPITMQDTTYSTFTVYDYCQITTIHDIDEISLSISIQPNPNRGHFNIFMKQIPDGEPIRVTIYGELGQTVYDMETLASPVLVVSDTVIPRGFYLVQIQFGEKSITKKMVVD